MTEISGLDCVKQKVVGAYERSRNAHLADFPITTTALID